MGGPRPRLRGRAHGGARRGVWRGGRGRKPSGRAGGWRPAGRGLRGDLGGPPAVPGLGRSGPCRGPAGRPGEHGARLRRVRPASRRQIPRPRPHAPGLRLLGPARLGIRHADAGPRPRRGSRRARAPGRRPRGPLARGRRDDPLRRPPPGASEGPRVPRRRLRSRGDAEAARGQPVHESQASGPSEGRQGRHAIDSGVRRLRRARVRRALARSGDPSHPALRLGGPPQRRRSERGYEREDPAGREVARLSGRPGPGPRDLRDPGLDRGGVSLAARAPPRDGRGPRRRGRGDAQANADTHLERLELAHRALAPVRRQPEAEVPGRDPRRDDPGDPWASLRVPVASRRGRERRAGLPGARVTARGCRPCRWRPSKWPWCVRRRGGGTS